MTTPAIVFVLLGTNPAPTLYHFAQMAKKRRPESEVLLITDQPDSHQEFPGRIVRYLRDDSIEPIRSVLKRFTQRRQLAGGYWLFTLERLFALKQLQFTGIQTPIVHLESDVLLTLTSEHEKALLQNCERTCVPRYSNDMGIASVLYSPSLKKLQDDLDSLGIMLQKEIRSHRTFCTDMRLLGLALGDGLFQELPSHPRDAWAIGGNNQDRGLVFDGLAYGQYLFGQDPVHRNGMRMSGHQNEFFHQKLSELRWSLGESDGSSATIGYEWGSRHIEIANIHVHSKETVEIPSLDSSRWREAIEEAIGLRERQIRGPFPDRIHSQRVSFINQIRLSAESGKLRTALNLLRYVTTRKRPTTN